MLDRREFSVRCQCAIIKRATIDGCVNCEGCGDWLKSRADFEIDHVIPEAMRPDADKKRPLVPADGQLLCKAKCHKAKTKTDKGMIALAIRQEAYGLGIKKPGKQKMRTGPRKERTPYQPGAGVPRLARMGFVSAKGKS